MINSKDRMNKKNWKLFFIGLFLFLLGFLFLYFVGSRPEGVLGFISPITVLAGTIVITFSFFAKEPSAKSEKSE